MKSGIFLMRLILMCLYTSLVLVTNVYGQGCPGIEGIVPRNDPREWCYGVIWQDSEADVLGTTAVAWWQGALYATRPLAGQIIVLEDVTRTGDHHEGRIVVEGLTHPNALIADARGLYIAGGAHLYRLNEDKSLDVLVDDVPSGTGLWTGGIAIYGDWLLVGTGAPCEGCIFDEDSGRGAILAYRIDETGLISDRRIIAHGLRYPATLLVDGDGLWVSDTARQAVWKLTGDYDELNYLSLIDAFEDDSLPVHFGYPYCIGIENLPDTEHNINGENFDCQRATPPLYALETGSQVLGLARYTHDNVPDINGYMIMVQSGAMVNGLIRGYSVVTFIEDDGHIRGRNIIPTDRFTTNNLLIALPAGDGWALSNGYSNYLNAIQGGFFPNHLYGLAVDDAGAVYFSWGNQRIIRMTPRQR